MLNLITQSAEPRKPVTLLDVGFILSHGGSSGYEPLRILNIKQKQAHIICDRQCAGYYQAIEKEYSTELIDLQSRKQFSLAAKNSFEKHGYS